MKSRKSLFWSCLGLCAIMGPMVPAYADTVSVNFESPDYAPGNINGQDGWKKTGPYDVEVVDNSAYGYTTLGSQSLRISNYITSGSFGDQTFAKPLNDAVGEADATNGSFSPGYLQRYYVMQFDIASADPNAQQPGMAISVSPDRGDGSRMSYLSFADGATGIDVTFYDVQGTTNPADFVPTTVATGLARNVPHTIKLTMQVNDGPSNDVVNVYIDGALVHTGTSWENYYRYDSEANAEQSPRIVKSIIFRPAGTPLSSPGAGFLLDNISLTSSYPPLANGSFENGPGGSYAYIGGGDSSSLPDWLTTQNGVEWFNPNIYGWGSAKDGNYAVDLAPYVYTGGGIQKSFDTVPGQYYRLQFYGSTLAASGRDGTGQVDVLIDGNPKQSFNFTNSSAMVNWGQRSVYFGATNPSTTVEFQNNQDPYAHFALIDAVSVEGPLPPPDVTVSKISTGVLNIKRNAGTTVLVNDTVSNLGETQTSKFVVAYHLSVDSVYGGGDDVVADTTRTILSLGAGADNAWTTGVLIPAETPPGVYHLCANADDGNAFPELDEANNSKCTTTTITVPEPDLVVSVIANFTLSVTAGGTMHVLDSTKNQGGSQALNFEVGYILSKNGIFGDGDDILLPTTRTLTSLGVGATSSATTDVTIPGDVAPGSYWIWAVADINNTVDEGAPAKENNNKKKASSKVTVTAP